MEFELDHESEGEFDLLVPRGELDIATQSHLRERMTQLLGDGRQHLVVDLGETTFIDSTALGCLIGGRERALSGGGSFALICQSPRIVKLLDLTRLSEIFTRYETREDWRAAAS